MATPLLPDEEVAEGDARAFSKQMFGGAMFEGARLGAATCDDPNRSYHKK